MAKGEQEIPAEFALWRSRRRLEDYALWISLALVLWLGWRSERYSDHLAFVLAAGYFVVVCHVYGVWERAIDIYRSTLRREQR